MESSIRSCLELQRGQVGINSKIKITITNRRVRGEQKRVLQMSRVVGKYNYTSRVFRRKTLYTIK